MGKSNMSRKSMQFLGADIPPRAPASKEMNP